MEDAASVPFPPLPGGFVPADATPPQPGAAPPFAFQQAELDAFADFVQNPITGAAGKIKPDEDNLLVLTKEVVSGVLSLDDVYRRQRRWPLVFESEFQAMVAKNQNPRSKKTQHKVLFAPDLVGAGYRYFRQGGLSQEAPVTSQAVQANLFKWFPRLEKILNAGGGNIIVAGESKRKEENVLKKRKMSQIHQTGGAVVYAVISASNNGSHRRYYGSDCDLFLVGLRESEAEAFLSKVCKEAFGDLTGVIFSRSENALTVALGAGESPYQFIFRLYDRPDMVLGGFDLGCCAVGFSLSQGVFFTPLGAFCLSTCTIPVDVSRRSVSFEVRCSFSSKKKKKKNVDSNLHQKYRLNKYMSRGFSVVFPSLMLSENDEHRVGKLRLTSRDHMVTLTLFQGAEGNEENQGDYGADEHPCVIAFGNILKAVRAQTDDLFAATVVGDTFEEVIYKPSVPGGAGLEALYKRRASSRYRSGDNVLERYKKWFGDQAVEFVVAKMKNDQAAIDTVVARTVDTIKRRLEAAARNFKPLAFLTIDPGRQFTGSFKPIIAPAREWYKERYVPTLIGMPSFEMVWLMKQILYGMPKDLFRLIVVSYVIPAIARHNIEKAGFKC